MLPLTGSNAPISQEKETSPILSDDVYVFPASFAQQRMWFLNQLEPDSAFYNIPTAARLDGKLNIHTLERALNEIIQRHETLRTTFTDQDGQPSQVISLQGKLKLEQVDLSALSEPAREAEAHRQIEQEARRPFDLAHGPLLRARLLRLGEEQHIILITMHHIISDGWSMGVLIREIAVLYTAYSNMQPSPLPDLPIQYADYVLWQQDRLKDNGLDDQLAYWTNVLSGELPVLKLPTDRPRGAVQNFLGATCTRKLPLQLSEKLGALSRTEDATLYMTLLAAFQVLLYRYTGQDDFTIGSPIANRTRAEVEDLIGLFINTLVLRANFTAPDPAREITFRDLLKRVRKTMLEAYANQDLPFDTLVESLHPNRDLSYNPLFQVMLILQNASAKSYNMPDLNIRVLDVEMGTSTFDLTLSMAEQEDGLAADLEYNTDLFDHETVERMLEHFEILLAGMVADPDQPINRLPMISDVERHQILVEWNDTDLEDPRLSLSLPKLLSIQASAVPHYTAVVLPRPETGETLTLTYQQLHQRANQVAHYLRDAGVQPGDCVGICIERSLEMVIAVLGVIKTGAAYLPLDPSYPRDRLAFMLEDAAPAALLTQQSLLAVLPATATRTILMDLDEPAITACPTDEPEVGGSPQDLAYIIYTSGSTGKPKGVQVLQSNLVNQYAAWESAYELTPGLAHLQMANFAFDVFSGDMVRALGSGGRLVLCPREYLLDPPRLFALMRQQNIAIAEFVPAVLRELIQYVAEQNQDMRFIQRLICGSDVWYVEEFNRVLKLCGPDTHLINSFGLTEATIDSSYFDGRELSLPPDAVVPIGKPYANNRLYILDRCLQPLPAGVPGELYVGGRAVTAGYLHRPDLNAERFIDDPFSGIPGSRLYKTGDMARYLRDGNIQFLGRLDFQVKIRGFRVEVGEIETALRQHPAIEDAVVTAVTPKRAGSRSDQVLIAYLVHSLSGEPELDNLRAYLRDRLPDYMVPSAFIFLEKLPLSQSGKVDRKALPAPDWSSDIFGPTAYTAPGTQTEQVLAGIWSQVLGLERVGIKDDFFELGGHSLLATQVISRIRAALGIEVPLRKIFELSSIEEMAAWIDSLSSEPADVELAAASAPDLDIQPAPRDQPIPLSFAQQRLWFLDQLEPDSPVYNIPDAVRMTGKLDLPALEKALNEVVRRHEILRTSFIMLDGQPAQVIAPELHLTIPVTDLQEMSTAMQEAEILRLAQQEASQSFHLSRLPLLRVHLVRLAEQDNLILLTIHHIIGDDWSTNVLIGEISLLYSAFLAGEPSPLPEMPIQYADFAIWQRAYLQGEVLDRHVSYWKRQLAGIPPLLELPTDHPRPAVQNFHGAFQSFRLSPEMTAGLEALAKREGASIFMLLLAAFQVLMMRYSGQEDICVGTPIANRNRVDTENLIGFFANTLALRTDLSGEPGFLQLLKRVREVCMGAFTHQDLPFERVVEITQPDRSLSHNPLFQVMFVLQNAPQRGEELPGLTLSPVEAHSGTAKFDLTLFMLEENGCLGGAMEYSTELFEANTIQVMLKHFEMLLHGILQDPDLQVSLLPLLSEAERHLLIAQWNQTEAPFPAEKPVHQLFSEQVCLSPTAIAVTYQHQSLTYAELDARSNQLAHYLRRLGSEPNTVVGISMERSLELMVGLLGILKTGAAYLPLDPHYPAERIHYMLSDSNAPILLTQQRLLAHLPETSAQVICLDRDWPLIQSQPETAPVCATVPDDLAYIIYTSGSTGKPKGAMIRHVGLTNYLTWCLQSYPLDRGIGTPVHSSISFDLTITSLYPALLSGKTVFMLPDDLGVEALGEFLRDHEDCSLIKITPAHLKLLSEQIPAERAARVTHAFIIGGENLLVDHIHFWQEHAPETAQVNEYGPTETVVGCCVYWAPRGKHQNGIIPIGKPIINTRLYILDPHLQPVPVGVRGELYIGGAGVARGYLNRPDLTAERFLDDPFCPEPGARMYKTGDLVRWLPDGNIECLGRIDFQVKIRGFRVELGEVEAVLSQHPAVKEAVVWVREDTPGGVPIKRLVAYIQPHNIASPPKVSDLREFLKERLPEYMVPSSYVMLDVLPLSSNGKVDRKALPDPEPLRPDLEASFSAPTSPNEKVLAEIWQQVLGLEQVGTGDNFFELGGDSILSLQIVSRARQRGIDLTPRTLFEHPTIAELAALAGDNHFVTAEQGPVTGEAPLAPVQRWFFQHDIVSPAHWNQSMLLDLPLQVDPAELIKAYRTILNHHDALRSRFVTTPDGEPRMIFHPAIDLQAELPEIIWQDLTQRSETDQQNALNEAIDALQSSMSLEHGPVFRAGAFWHNGGTWLFMSAHHLVIDAVSWRILLDDLLTLMQPVSAGAPSRLPAKTSSYKEWAENLPRFALSQEITEQLPFWLEQVETPSATLPLDILDGSNREKDVETLSIELLVDETQQLLHAAANVYHCDVPALLLAALHSTLVEWTGKSSWQIEMEGHGRETPDGTLDLSRTIGWFTSLYPVTLRVDAHAASSETLHQVVEQLSRVPKNNQGYGLLHTYHPDPIFRQRLRMPAQAQISFNYLGRFNGGEQEGNTITALTHTGDRGSQNERTCIWEITGGLMGDQIQMEWSFSRSIHHRETIEHVSALFQRRLREFLFRETAETPGGPSMAHLSEFDWDSGDIEAIMNAIHLDDETE